MTSVYQPNNMYPQAYPPVPYVIRPKQEKNSFGAGLLGALGGGFVAGLYQPIVKRTVVPAMQKNGTLPKDEVNLIHKTAEQIVKDTGLKDKGVRLRYLGSIPIKKEPQKPFNIYETRYVNSVREGLNAFFVSKDIKGKKNGVKKIYIKKNSIVLPKEKNSGFAFHEIGHALNYNKSMLGKTLQMIRPLSLLGPMVIGLYGAFSKKSKPKEGEELTSKQKINNFIRNNAGLLAFGVGLPMLVEEGMATYKGEKLASKILSKDLMAKALKVNKVAYCSYALHAIFGALGAFAAVKIKDSIVES